MNKPSGCTYQSIINLYLYQSNSKYILCFMYLLKYIHYFQISLFSLKVKYFQDRFMADSNVVCMSSGDLLIWRNFEFWSRIFVLVYFQLLKISLKLKKREFHWTMFFVGPIRDLFSQLKKKKTNIRTSKFKISSN